MFCNSGDLSDLLLSFVKKKKKRKAKKSKEKKREKKERKHRTSPLFWVSRVEATWACVSARSCAPVGPGLGHAGTQAGQGWDVGPFFNVQTIYFIMAV